MRMKGENLMKKRIVSIILVVSVVISLYVPAFAVEQEKNEGYFDNKIISFVEAKINVSGYKIKTSNIKSLIDFGGNEYKLVECIPTGYYIIHPESGIVVESSPSTKSPYYGIKSKMYYGGPTYYYFKSGDNYIHTVLDEVIDNNMLDVIADICNSINNELISQRNTSVTNYFKGDYSGTPPVVNRAGVGYWVTSYTWFQNRESGFYAGYSVYGANVKYKV